jgi:hypothetical protein
LPVEKREDQRGASLGRCASVHWRRNGNGTRQAAKAASAFMEVNELRNTIEADM